MSTWTEILKRHLGRQNIKLDRDQRFTLASLLENLHEYDELESRDPKIAPLLKGLGELEGGLVELATALPHVNVGKLLFLPDPESYATFREGLNARGYGLKLYNILHEHYHHLWYYHPAEVAAAESEGRDCEDGHYNDVYHTGLFDLCNALEQVHNGLKARKRRHSKPSH